MIEKHSLFVYSFGLTVRIFFFIQRFSALLFRIYVGKTLPADTELNTTVGSILHIIPGKHLLFHRARIFSNSVADWRVNDSRLVVLVKWYNTLWLTPLLLCLFSILSSPPRSREHLQLQFHRAPVSGRAASSIVLVIPGVFLFLWEQGRRASVLCAPWRWVIISANKRLVISSKSTVSVQCLFLFYMCDNVQRIRNVKDTYTHTHTWTCTPWHTIWIFPLDHTVNHISKRTHYTSFLSNAIETLVLLGQGGLKQEMEWWTQQKKNILYLNSD